MVIINNNITNTSLDQYAISGTNSIIESLYTSENRKENIRECIQNSYYDQILIKHKDIEEIYNKRIGCNSPLCPHCVEIRKRVTRKILRSVVSQYKNPRFLTLAFKNAENISKIYLKKISSQFNTFKKYLGRKKLFLNNYVSVMEIKYTEAKKWNLHYHIVYDGDYIPQKTASNILRKVTKGESYIVDIRSMCKGDKIRSKIKSLHYITKYISKINFTNNSFELMFEYYNAIKKIRFVRVYGIKPIKEQGKYVLYKKYLIDKNLDYLEVAEHIAELQNFIVENELKKFNLNFSYEDNFFMFSTTKKILDCLEV